MKYRLVKKPCWWTSLYDDREKFLYWCYDVDNQRFEIGCMATARQHKFNFTEEELEQMEKDYSNLKDEFVIMPVEF